MLETGVLIDLKNNGIHFHCPKTGRTSTSLEDSSELWEIIWENRLEVLGFAHSHPGSGVPSPSYTDLTTFSAIELGLGKRLKWWITSQDHVVLVEWAGPDRLDYRSEKCDAELTSRMGWLSPLRHLSEYTIHIERT